MQAIMRDPIYKTRPVGPSPARIEAERINDFIILSEGYSNSYLIETDEDNIQINAGLGMEAAIHAQSYAPFTDKWVRYLIVTQGHPDHVGGVAYARAQNPGLELIATSGNQEHQSYERRLLPFRADRSGFAFRQRNIDYFQWANENSPEGAAQQDFPVPDISFDDTYDLEYGGVHLQLFAVPGAETNDSLIIWLPEHRICFTGNLFGCPFGHFPNLITIRGDRYRDALTVAAAAEKVRALEPEMILYGHHGPIVGEARIQEELIAYRDAIHHVHDATVEGMNAGEDVHTLMRQIEIPPEMEVGQGYGCVPWSVRAIWEAYAGWFHHESTTELYGVPQKAVHSDLIDLAGGPDALAERARERFTNGDRLEALHLLDVVLSQHPEHPQALAVSIDVHRALLAEADNFWLENWLRHQIEEMEKKTSA